MLTSRKVQMSSCESKGEDRTEARSVKFKKSGQEGHGGVPKRKI